MASSVVERLRQSEAVFRVALATLPLLARITRGRLGTARLLYRIYSITPLTLASLAARSCGHAAEKIRPGTEKLLLEFLSARFAFDSNEKLEDWVSICDSALTACDSSLARGVSLEDTADLLFEALQLLFHPSVHQGVGPSPFVDSPADTRMLVSHECIQLLQRGDFRKGKVQQEKTLSTEHHANQPLNLLVITDTNLNFMGPLLEAWSGDRRLSLRVRDLVADNVNPEWWHPRNTILDRLRGETPEPPDEIRADLQWADVIFVEWSQALAARLSSLELAASLVVRLHKYEAFIPTPSLTNWGNVNRLVTITPYMSTLMGRIVPGIEKSTKVDMIPNVTKLRHFMLPKHQSASRTLGVIQYASIVKDPLWSLDVLELLQEHDPEWTLLLIGTSHSTIAVPESEVDYFLRFEERVKTFGNSVKFLGHQSNLPEIFRDIGVVLSSSRVEGAPVSIQEGVASGALPVIRNWPMLKALNAAGSLYPHNWVVESPAEAAERILTWADRAASPVDEEQLRTWMVENFDADKLIPILTEMILDEGSRVR